VRLMPSIRFFLCSFVSFFNLSSVISVCLSGDKLDEIYSLSGSFVSINLCMCLCVRVCVMVCVFHVMIIVCTTHRKTRFRDDVQRTNISGLVSASEFRWFWISWRNNNISYGRGNQRDKNVVGWYNDDKSVVWWYSDSDTNIDFMQISSFEDNNGDWIIPAVYYIEGLYMNFRYILHSCHILVQRSLHTTFVH